MSRIAAGYVRRSSATTENPGNDSREAQLAAIARLAGPDASIYTDWNVSGSGDGSKRPEYLRLKADIESGSVGSVAAYSLTRLGRNARELMALIELCRAHDVALRTAQESIDTSNAMGRAMVQMMAVMAELELEQGKERSASARQAREDRYRAASLPVPSSLPPYGWRHVPGDDGLTRMERDPDVDLTPVIDAYNEAKTVRGTAVLLNDRGIPAPKGGEWAVTPLRRMLERLADSGDIVLPERHHGRRSSPKVASLFAGLLSCHCGRRMTPNVTRGQYYCAAARSNADHGRMSVTEAALRAVLEPAADEYVRTIRLESRAVGEDLAKKRLGIERRQQALDARLDVDRITPEAYKKATLALRQELADIEVDARVMKTLRVDRLPSWEDAEAMNRHLRRIWTKVQLDNDMVPEPYWRDPSYRLDPDLLAAQEAEHLDPEAAGLVVLPVGRRAVSS